MASDYDAITKHNERQLGLDTASRKTQVCMYSDSTHFIYEILQNADDHGATEVHFCLRRDSLTIDHNATPFSEENVKAITYFGKSTSRDDLVKTGRFGVGFKSVFAFTASPIVLSGEEHFQIFGLYRVKEHPYPEGFPADRTRIVLPFNHVHEEPNYVDEWMRPEDAYSKIAERLTGLNMNTLLFTHNIREIKWQIEGKSGHYLREDKLQTQGRITTITDSETIKRHLVFARTPSWQGKVFKDVEIAFGLDDQGQIVSIQDFLYVLFATTQDTHLQFVINGPYRTNPSRETISDEDHFNRHLMKETCALLEGILPRLRDQGLLAISLLGVLPNPSDSLPSFYTPLFDTVRSQFRSEELIPTDDGGYVAGMNTFQGPASLRDVFKQDDLIFMTGNTSAKWAKGFDQKKHPRPDTFLKSLGISLWGFQELQDTFEKKFCPQFVDSTGAQRGKNAEWIATRPDEWLQKLYVLLSDAVAKKDCDQWTLKRCAIVRVIEHGQESHVLGANAYFPKGKSYRDLPQVKRSVFRSRTEQHSQRIENALVTLGVRQIGDEERVDLVLDTYYVDESPLVHKQQHLDHMRMFLKWWKKEQDADKFSGRAIFRVSGSEGFHPGANCFLDSPLKASGLSLLFNKPRKGINERFRLWSRYKEIGSEGLCDFAVECGAIDCIPIAKQSCYQHPHRSKLRQDYKTYVRFTSTGDDQDFVIEGLDAILGFRDQGVNHLIWKTLSKADPEVLWASFRPNRSYNKQTDKSSLIIALSNFEWIPDIKGNFRRPADITKDKLHPEFKYDNRNGWLDEIGFGESEKLASEEFKKQKEMAAQLGVRSGIVELLRNLPEDEREEAQEMIQELLERKAAAHRHKMLSGHGVPYHRALAGAFTSGSNIMEGQESLETGGISRNPARRTQLLEDEIAVAIRGRLSGGEQFTFGVRKQWKGKNDSVRVKLVEWYHGKCQICNRTFIQANQNPYFEGLYLVPYTNGEWLDRPGNVICLCAWHSAMFQFGAKRVDNLVPSILAFVPRAEGGDGEPRIILTLCGEKTTIRFHEDHFLELKVMLQKSKEAENE